MNYPTEDQLRARELVCLYEGVGRCTAEMVGNSYMVETADDEYYAISPTGNTILKSTGFLTDTTELTERLANPAAFAPDEFNDPPDVLTSEIPGAVSDFDHDRAEELRAMGLADDNDRDYWRFIEKVR